ncbi:MAG: YkuS family protein [Bacillota bacterium]
MLIAVEDGLSQVERALRQEGFEITKLTPGAMSQRVDAAVVTGMSNNFMGIHDTNGNKFPVIEAAGMTADEIVQKIRDRLAHK